MEKQRRPKRIFVGRRDGMHRLVSLVGPEPLGHGRQSLHLPFPARQFCRHCLGAFDFFTCVNQCLELLLFELGAAYGVGDRIGIRYGLELMLLNFNP